jgi:hypothetical protein
MYKTDAHAINTGLDMLLLSCYTDEYTTIAKSHWAAQRAQTRAALAGGCVRWRTLSVATKFYTQSKPIVVFDGRQHVGYA